MSAASPRRRDEPLLQRVAFRTSRFADFCGVEELTKQCGHGKHDWPRVIFKELADNSLDACEKARVAPEITIEVTDDYEIILTDNGPGLPDDTIAGILDFGVRVSTNEAYVSPSRGQQGNAYKVIIAMAYALSGSTGSTLIESHGHAREIIFQMDRVRRTPVILPLVITPSNVKIGTRVTVRWPREACTLLEDAKSDFLQLAAAYVTFNPHLTMRGTWFGEQFIHAAASAPDWSKWRTCDPTSSHWYTPALFERYMAALVSHDQDNGNKARTTGDFIAELDGLKGSAKRKAVLDEVGAFRVKLADFFDRGPTAIIGLLGACRAQTREPQPQALGLIGKDHLFQQYRLFGGAEASFDYRKKLLISGWLPYVIEVAGGYRSSVDDNLCLVLGVNSSAAIGSPFQLGGWRTLGGVLADQYINETRRFVLIIHLACPRVDFADRGKSIMVVPRDVSDALINLVKIVTEPYRKAVEAVVRGHRVEAKAREDALREQKRRLRSPQALPQGTLAEVLFEARAMTGYPTPIKNLCVLGDANEPFTSWKRKRQAQWFADVWKRLIGEGERRHWRGFFYRLLSHPDILGPDGKPVINDYKNWVMMQKAANAARWLLLLPFDSVTDARNAECEIYVPEPPIISTDVTGGVGAELPPLEAVVPFFNLLGFKGRQTHRIIFYGEKTSLGEIVRPIAMQIGAELLLVTGESSTTRIKEVAARIVQDGRPAVILYFSDFDPSGWQMPVSVARKLQALKVLFYPSLDVKLYPVALTYEQVRDLGLPSAPLKDKEKRSQKWRNVFDHDQTEIDALVELHPDVLRQAVYDAIRPFYDDSLDGRVREAQTEWQKKATSALKDHPAYQDARAEIEDAWEEVNDAITRLEDAQLRASDALRDAIPEPPELPEPEPKGELKQPLFDSTEDFLSSTRKLIQHKKLEFDEDDEDEEGG